MLIILELCLALNALEGTDADKFERAWNYCGDAIFLTLYVFLYSYFGVAVPTRSYARLNA